MMSYPSFLWPLKRNSGLHLPLGSCCASLCLLVSNTRTCTVERVSKGVSVVFSRSIYFAGWSLRGDHRGVLGHVPCPVHLN